MKKGLILGTVVVLAGAAWLARTILLPTPISAANEFEITKKLGVGALGRLEPLGGVIRIAGPAGPGMRVIKQVVVKEGDVLERGQKIAVMNNVDVLSANVSRLQIELADAESQLRRQLKLFHTGAVTEESRDRAQAKVELTKAIVAQAQAELELANIYAPQAGVVLKVVAHDGEEVTSAGIIEMGDTAHMQIAAEVFATDIARVHEGQSATITSAVFDNPLTGKVTSIGYKVGQLNLVDATPNTKIDARIVEVHIDFTGEVPQNLMLAKLTGLLVNVVFDP